MDPLTLAAIGGVAGAAKGVGQGLTTAIGGTAYFTKEDKARQKELQRLQRRGQLGLTDIEKRAIQSEQAVERGGMLRASESQRAKAYQALQNQGVLSGREMFLAEQVAADTEAKLRARQAEAMSQENIAARQAQQAELAQLAQQERMRKQAVRSGLTQALTLGIFGGVSGYAGERLAMERADAFQRKQEQEALNIAYGKKTGGFSLSNEESTMVPDALGRYF
jgi:hypothetical protein